MVPKGKRKKGDFAGDEAGRQSSGLGRSKQKKKVYPQRLHTNPSGEAWPLKKRKKTGGENSLWDKDDWKGVSKEGGGVQKPAKECQRGI